MQLAHIVLYQILSTLSTLKTKAQQAAYLDAVRLGPCCPPVLPSSCSSQRSLKRPLLQVYGMHTAHPLMTKHQRQRGLLYSLPFFTAIANILLGAVTDRHQLHSVLWECYDAYKQGLLGWGWCQEVALQCCTVTPC